MDRSRWRIWVDTGGTFTDALGVDPQGRLQRAKVLSSSRLRASVVEADGTRVRYAANWEAPDRFAEGLCFQALDGGPALRVVGHDAKEAVLSLEAVPQPAPAAGALFELLSDEEAPLLAARLLSGTPAADPLPACDLRLGTTRGTNALLERRGARTAFVTTRGFADVLRIGNQDRPDLFDLEIAEAPPLYETVVEVDERLAADGSVLTALAADAAQELAARLADDGIESVAVALLHAYRNPAHERVLREALEAAGVRFVSCSAELSPTIRLVPRARTAVVDAYLAPVIRDYLDAVAAGPAGGSVRVMTSGGGLVSPEFFNPKDSLLSGPAGGVVGAALAGRRAGCEKVLAFDMGGTSTDVARIAGDFEYRFELRVGDAELLAPALAIESVAAGGGSICWFDGERLRVGPRSAGADPGPACYGAGGPLTLTDVNLLSGRLEPERFGLPLRVDRARACLEALQTEVAERSGETIDEPQLLDGLRAIADETMADAIRRVSLRRGYDPAEHALVAFGGAGGQHACAVAERLGIDTVIVPADAGLLSALGMGHARIERFAVRQVLQPLAECEAALAGWFEELDGEARAALLAEGEPAESIEVRQRWASLRYAGQDATLEVDWTADRSLEPAFVERYGELFGHHPASRAVELESLRVVASVEPEKVPGTFVAGKPVPVAKKVPGTFFVVPEAHGTTVVEAGWSAVREADGALRLTRSAAGEERDASRHAEAVRLELFTHRFVDIARSMGERLRQTAVSTNVKERLDFSCALLDADGFLVTNAPHIPVHLGALGLCVREVARALPLEPGDVAVTNHPAFGGSHLPDVTVITPVFDPADETRRLGYVANRAHHAEIGGARPGSMPPDATRLAEEGVVLAPQYLVRRGRPRFEEIERRLREDGRPSRAVGDNLSDLRAAVAANSAGAQALRKLAARHSSDTVAHYMSRLTSMAERRLREALREYPDGIHRATERLDDGAPLSVAVHVQGDRATFDFSGSAGVHPGNLNATPAIVHSAVIYVLRLMLRRPLPLNEGLLRPVNLRIPPGMLAPDFGDDPACAPAVVGGNVETSQRLVDTLIKALRLAACSQGTMNNLLFGDASFGYYETICGGCGAGPHFHGRSAVHSHMTNTRITDPEVLEHRYPVRLERFALRERSGGDGRFRGGDGVVRELTFLGNLSLSLLTQHRVVAPYGMDGGDDGGVGRQTLVRAGGARETLTPLATCEVHPGDRLVLETPGGGGWGPREDGLT